MKPETDEQAVIRSYLLGRIAQDDLPEVEERFLADSEFYEELTIVEDELIDEYLCGELSVSDGQSFESQFITSPERLEKLRFAAALRNHVAAVEGAQPQEDLHDDKVLSEPIKAIEPPPKKRTLLSFLPFQDPIVSYALAAAVLLFVVGGAWVALRNWQSPARSGPVFAIELAPGVITRDGGETPSFVVPPDSRAVRLQLDLPKDEYPSYEVVLLDADGHTVLTQKNLKPKSVDGRPALFVETETFLPPGDYRVKLNGLNSSGSTESVAGYSFRIQSK